MNTDEHRLNATTEAVVGAAFAIANFLGCGFLEKVCENALVHELRKRGFNAQPQFPITVLYDGVVVGEYVADVLVDDLVIVELKVVKAFDDIHTAQCINYLKATGKPVCLLLNFARPRIEYKRLRV